MKVFKFGGASIRDAKSICNVTKVLKSEGDTAIFLVASAMGKMTNAFEEVVHCYHTNSDELNQKLDSIKDFHTAILVELFENTHPIYREIDLLFLELSNFFIQNNKTNYDYLYDQLVVYGEILSTKTLSAYLNSVGISNKWLDARKLIKTDSNYRSANVDWEATCQNIQQKVNKDQLCITQGFIGGTSETQSTTLGREGSDFSAAIFTYCLDAKSLTIWKDVPGVLTADPRHFEKTELLHQISYREALEMAFYGASVIHPKTIKPLENKNIPLFVKSFMNPAAKGTKITKGVARMPQTSSYTLKSNQILLSISAKDFSFLNEYQISQIFRLFATYKIKVNLIQNTALNYSVCMEDPYIQFEYLREELLKQYAIDFKKDVRLLSIRHFSTKNIQEIKNNNNVLLTQQTAETAQFILE